MSDREGRVQLPTAGVQRRRRIPLVWIVPLLTALIAAWLAWDTFSKRGPTITISFEQRRRPDRGPVPAQVQERRDGHGEEHRRVAGSHPRAGDGGDHARGRAAADRQDDLLGGQARSFSPAASRASIRCCRLLYRHAAVERHKGKPKRHFIGKEDPPILQAWAKGTTYKLRQQAAGLDQPGFADLLPRSRGRHRAGLGARRSGRATSPSMPSCARRSTSTCMTTRLSGMPRACR